MNFAATIPILTAGTKLFGQAQVAEHISRDYLRCPYVAVEFHWVESEGRSEILQVNEFAILQPAFYPLS